MCVECKTKRIFVIACQEKSSYFNRKYRIIRLFYFQKYKNSFWIKESFKVNQTDTQDNQCYLGCKAKRTVRLTFLEKRSYFNRKYRNIRLFFFKNIEIFLDQRVVQIDIPEYQYNLSCNARRTGPPNFPRKNVCISYGNLLLFPNSFE